MSVGNLNPIDNPEAWDVVEVAGVKSPGLCEVSEPKRPYKWDVKEGKGTKGSTTTFVNMPPAKFSITFKAWTRAHFAAWDTFLPKLKYDPNRKDKEAFDIFHPALADIDIRSVTTEVVGGWKHDGEGMYVRTIEFLEYFPPGKSSVVSTPSGAADDTSSTDIGTQPDPAIVQAQTQVGDLAAQYQKGWQP